MILAAWYHTILAFLFAVLAIIVMGVILLQRGRGVGLAGAFGGTPGGTAFGAKTGDVLTWVTIAGAILLLTYTVVLNFVFVPTGPQLTGTAEDGEDADTVNVEQSTTTEEQPEEGALLIHDHIPVAALHIFGEDNL